MGLGKEYTINYLPKVVEEDIPNLPVTVKKVVQRAIKERLAVDPISYGKPLRHSLVGIRRIRVGDYRIIYSVNLKTTSVTVTAIKHRKDVYDE